VHEEEALQIALSESLHVYHTSKEEEDLARAIQMSLGRQDGEQERSYCDSGKPLQLLLY
jgi:Ubiquitin interaction motif